MKRYEQSPSGDPKALCRSWLRNNPVHIHHMFPWDPSVKLEDHETVALLEYARSHCFQCPLLASCEKYLRHLEREGLKVAGVVAARSYGSKSVDPSVRREVKYCRECHREMHDLIPDRTNEKSVAKAAILREGTYGRCAPCTRRWYRRKAKGELPPARNRRRIPKGNSGAA